VVFINYLAGQLTYAHYELAEFLGWRLHLVAAFGGFAGGTTPHYVLDFIVWP
jgi:hypothetical protein